MSQRLHVESNDSELVEEPWFVYICESKAHHYCVGISLNPEQRLMSHNSGIGSKMAKDQGAFRLLYISKEFTTKPLARKREMQIKRWSRVKKEKLIQGTWE